MIVLATGFHDFDPQKAPQYGYGRLPNVVTGMEMERMINTGGPTGGKVLLKDGSKAEESGHPALRGIARQGA